VRGIGDRLTIGERITFYRTRLGLTQTELANLAAGSELLGLAQRCRAVR
jgi:transcriptional regulator with XRE-family HTH domain